jgi:hypothetical protein
MKKLILLCFSVSFFAFFSAFSQKEKIENLPNFDKKAWNFGYYLGFNSNSFKVNYNDTSFTGVGSSDPATLIIEEGLGFIVGVIAERKLHKNVTLRFEPGLMSNVKKITFNNSSLPTQEDKDKVRDVSGTYLHMPLLLKFSTDRYRNIKPYVLGGLSFDWNFSANEDNPDDNRVGEFRTTKANYMYELGIGVDLYLPYFKFSPSIRGVFGINNELIRDNISSSGASPWTAPIDEFSTRGVFLKFTFE